MTLFTRSGIEKSANATSPTGKPFWRHHENCHRCGGAGGSESWRHTGWTCYQCGGSGKGAVRDDPLYTAEQLAKLNAAQAKRDAAKQAKRDAERAARLVERMNDFALWARDNVENIDLINGAWKLSFNRPGFEYAHDRLGNTVVALQQSRIPFYFEDAIKLAADVYDRDAAIGSSSHFGTIGQRMDVTFEVVFSKGYENAFGVTYLTIGRTPNGNIVFYKGSHGWDKGETVTAKWTIKAHQRGNDESAQTVLARPTFPKA